jgi:F0F1-type ATP synthase assembly protein I
MGWAVTGTLLSGMAVWGGAGWLLDRWLDVRLFAPIGIILGMAVAIYVVVVKYGAADPPPGSRSSHTTGGRASRSGTQKGQR